MADRDPQSVEARLENAKKQLELAREKAVSEHDPVEGSIQPSKTIGAISDAIASTDAALDLDREDA